MNNTTRQRRSTLGNRNGTRGTVSSPAARPKKRSKDRAKRWRSRRRESNSHLFCNVTERRTNEWNSGGNRRTPGALPGCFLGASGVLPVKLGVQAGTESVQSATDQDQESDGMGEVSQGFIHSMRPTPPFG